MQRQHHGQVLGQQVQTFHQALQTLGIVSVVGAVHGAQHELAGLDTEGFQRVRAALGHFGHLQGAVIHHVTHLLDARAADAFAQQVGGGDVRHREVHVGDVVGQHPVDLFRHAVERAQAGLDVSKRQVDLGRSQGTGQRAVGVTVDNDDIGLLVDVELFQGLQHAAGHGAVPAGRDVQVEGRRRHAQFFKEHIGHVLVVVLASVHDGVLDVRILFQGLTDNGGLHELGSCADNREDACLGHVCNESLKLTEPL